MIAVGFAVVLLFGNAFFVAAEFGLIATRRSQIEPAALSGNRRARVTLKALDEVTLMMAGAQLGVTVCSLGLGAAGEPAVSHLLDGPMRAAGLPDGLLRPLSVAIALVVVVFLHIVIGEMVPKNLALAGPERSALALGPVLAAVVRPVRPLIAALSGLANAVLRLARVEPVHSISSAFTPEEVAALVAESRGAGLLDEDDHALLAGVLSLEDRTADAVLVPASALSTVPDTVTTGELQRLVARTGFSRFPVRGNGRMIGYVHIGDLLDLLDVPDAQLPADRIRRLPAVRSDAVLGQILTDLRESGSHLVEIRDASGASQGVLFFADVLRALIGEH